MVVVRVSPSKTFTPANVLLEGNVMTTSVLYSNQQGRRDRPAFAVIVSSEGVLTTFEGVSIPKLAVVISEKYAKSGKWSHTVFDITLATGARMVAGHTGWETGMMLEGVASATGLPCGSWGELAYALGVDRSAAEAWLRVAAPGSSKVLDERAELLAGLE